MRDFILTSTSTVLCPHGGVVRHNPSLPCEYRIEGSPPMLVADQYIVVGCPYVSAVGGSGYPMPSPCRSVTWTNPSVFLLIRGVPALKHTSVGICMSTAMVPQGSPIVTSFQMRVREPDEVTFVN